MKKRVLSLLLAAALCLSLLPGAALAASDKYKSWSQYDSRWGSLSIASNGSKKWTMKDYGCFIVAVTKMLIYCGEKDTSYTPKKCLQDFLDHGLLDKEGNAYTTRFNSSKFLKDCAPSLRYETSPSHSAWKKAEAIQTLKPKLDDNYYIIVCAKTTKSDGTSGTHWMLVDRIEDNIIYVMDNGGVVSLYKEYKGGIIDQIYFKCKKKAPADPEPTGPAILRPEDTEPEPPVQAPEIVSVGADPEDAGVANDQPQTVLVDGVMVEFQMYSISGAGGVTNYIKLRDLADALNGSAAQFNVTWSKAAGTGIQTGTAYVPNGTENKTNYTGPQSYQKGLPTTDVNGVAVPLRCFALKNGAYTYYKLRDLGQALGFNVGYDKTAKMAFIETDRPYDGKDR